jgi:hypothetical protein
VTRATLLILGLAVLLAAALLWELVATLAGHRELPATEHTRLQDGCGTTHEETNP